MSGFVLTRQGAIYVAEQSAQRTEIDRALKRLDQRLFLEKARRRDGKDEWSVWAQIGSGAAPVCVCTWRDENGEPLPLTWRIVDKVKSLEGRNTAKEVLAHNDRLRRDAAREIGEAGADAYFEQEARKRRLACLHRGVHLRMARDRQRARGENV